MPDRIPISLAGAAIKILAAYGPHGALAGEPKPLNLGAEPRHDRQPAKLVVFIVYGLDTRTVRDRLRHRVPCALSEQHTTARAAWDAYRAVARAFRCRVQKQDYMVVPHVATGTISDRGVDEYQPIWRTRTGAWRLNGKRYSTFALAVSAGARSEVPRG